MSISDSCRKDPTISIIENQDAHNIDNNDIFPNKVNQIDEKNDPATFRQRSSIIDPQKNAGLAANKTQIQQFYSGEVIFITGGSGFLGKVLIEKLLRSCTDITTIYVLIRSKGEKDVEDRFNDIFQCVMFDRLKEEVPNFRSKIVPIKGDLRVEKLGLSDHDENLLKQNVSIIFHVGATVRFNEELRIATMINVNATKYILDMAHNMKNLKTFVHVSTLYANCHMEYIEETFYQYPMTYQTFLTTAKNLKPGEVSEQIVESFSKWPNTYVITKAIAESLIRDESEKLPIGIFRPGIVISSADEPAVGWVDNYYGPIGVIAFFYKGLLNCIWGNPKCTANLVPVDKVVNALIVAAWDVCNRPDRRGNEMLIYNYESLNEMPMTWGQYCNIANMIAKKYLLRTPKMIMITQSILFDIYYWFSHTLPAILIDIWSGDGHNRSKQKFYDKLHVSIRIIGHFASKAWRFTNYNVQSMWYKLDENDKHLFNFDMRDFNWQIYLENHFKGIFIYLFKENPDDLKVNRVGNYN